MQRPAFRVDRTKESEFPKWACSRNMWRPVAVDCGVQALGVWIGGFSKPEMKFHEACKDSQKPCLKEEL